LPEDVEKESFEEVQQNTDSYIAKVDVIVAAKEKDIMTV
jgi:ribosome recycling factor